MKHYGKYMEVKKIHPQDDYILRVNYTKMLSTCPDLADISLNNFMRCCNSVFILTDKIYGNTLGIIACRQSNVEELKLTGLDYYCQNEKYLHKIEAFHCDSHVSDEDCLKLIQEALADKNDGFIYYKPACPTLKNNENLQKLIGFMSVETIDVDGNKTIYFVKRPSTYGEEAPEEAEEANEIKAF